jgi:hypothetical protein
LLLRKIRFRPLAEHSAGLREHRYSLRHLRFPQSCCPIPAAQSSASFGPRPAQQEASFPSTTTAGTDRMPSDRAVRPSGRSYSGRSRRKMGN